MKEYLNGSIIGSNITLEKVFEPGLEIKTENSLLFISKTQPIYFSLPTLNNENIVYLMYRENFGFRVGLTNKGYQKDKKMPTRLSQERAQRLWVLDIVDINKARFLEEYYSLKYGIPTAVFEGVGRGLDQNYINSIFKEFGNNGLHLLKQKGYSFDNSHVLSSSKNYRDYISLVQNSTKGSIYTFESSDLKDKQLLLDNNIDFTKSKKDGIRIRKYSMNSSELSLNAKSLSKLINKRIIAKINFDKKYYLTTASSLTTGFDLINKTSKDKIISISDSTYYYKCIGTNKSNNCYINDILIGLNFAFS